MFHAPREFANLAGFGRKFAAYGGVTVTIEAYRDRVEAGKLLANALTRFAGREDVIVLGLPRGGVPIAHEVARKLAVPFDVFVVRKLGVPGHEELAMGAIATGGIRLVNHDVVSALGISEQVIDDVARIEQVELTRREDLYRGGQPPIMLTGRVVIIVDDGLATGSTMRAAVKAVREQHPVRVVVAVPVGAPSTCDELRKDADEVVCVRMPDPFVAVGLWYRDFTPTTDREVRSLLEGRAQ